MIASLGIGFAGAALGQSVPFGFEEHSYSRESLPENKFKLLNPSQVWRQDLEKSGIFSRTGPYRVALPLAQIGENGPTLNFTYVPRNAVASGVYMFFIRFNID